MTKSAAAAIAVAAAAANEEIAEKRNEKRLAPYRWLITLLASATISTFLSFELLLRTSLVEKSASVQRNRFYVQEELGTLGIGHVAQADTAKFEPKRHSAKVGTRAVNTGVNPFGMDQTQSRTIKKLDQYGKEDTVAGANKGTIAVLPFSNSPLELEYENQAGVATVMEGYSKEPDDEGEEDGFGDDDSSELSQDSTSIETVPEFDIYDPGLRSFDTWSNLPLKYRVTDNSTGKFLLYQPSGGWGNQRLILRWAIIVANALNRTLVLPPVAPHSNYYVNFNKFDESEVIPMHMVLDIDELNKIVYRGVRVHLGSMKTYETMLPHLSWRRFERNPAYNFIMEDKIKQKWIEEPADVLYWHKTSMWKCCQTPDVHYYTRINYSMMFSLHLQAASMRAMNHIGKRYNALHIRRGDSGFRERRSIKHYMAFHSERLQRFDRSLPLYVATDEPKLEFFRPLVKKFGFTKVYFAKDLDRAELDALLVRIPEGMHGTVMAFVDQIICDFAERWSGSTKSTFSYYISAMRNRRRKKGKYFKLDISNTTIFPR